MSAPICRICGTSYNLMHVLQGGEELLEKLRLCANIKIDFECDLPKHICLKCEQGLSFSYRLRKQGEATELKLRQQLKEKDSVDLSDEVDDIEDELLKFQVQNATKKNKAGNEDDDDDDAVVEVIECLNEDINSQNSQSDNQVANVSWRPTIMTKINENPQSANQVANENWRPTIMIKQNQAIEILMKDTSFVEDKLIVPHPDTGQQSLMVGQADIIETFTPLKMTTAIENRTLTSGKTRQSQGSNQKICEISGSNKEVDINITNGVIIVDDDIEIVDIYQPLVETPATTITNTSTTIPHLELQSFPTAEQHENIEETKTSFDTHDMVIVRNQANSPEYLQEDECDNEQANMEDIFEEYQPLDAAIIAQDNLENELIETDFQLLSEDVSKSFHSDISLQQNIGFRTLEKYSVDLVDKVEVLSEPDYDNVEDDDVEAIAADLEDAVDEVELNINDGQFVQPNNMNSQLLQLQNHGQLKVNLIYKCETCSKIFQRQSEYRQHIKVHGSQRFNCEQCKKWFPTRYRLRQHERTHADDIDLFICSICANHYRHSQNLKRHMRSAHNSEDFNPLQCGVCHEVFMRPDVLKKHMLTHVEDRHYVCEICKKTFKTIFYLVAHKRTHLPKTNGAPQLPANSSTNTPTYTSTDSSSSPQHSATPQRVYTCCYCGKVSKHSFSHKNHMRTHTLERPYDCEFCVKSFRTLAAKITHERIHNDVRPYQCDRCLLSFRQHSHLKEHKLIHDGVMSFVCNVCNIAFTKKSNLKVHMRIHTGERPYKCAESECGEQFAKLSQLKRHAAQAHSRDVGVLNDDGEDDDEDDGNEEDDDEEDVERSVEADGEPFHAINDDELLGLDVSIGAEETAMETILDNHLHFNSLYILDDINSS